MKLFKESKKQPIKLRNFKFIGFHPDYETCCYYYKELPHNNFELIEATVKGRMNRRGKLKKAELCAGTKIQILDAFMSAYLYNKINGIEYSKDSCIENAIEYAFADLEEYQKCELIKKFKADIPKEIKKAEKFKQYIDQGYKVLYCSNDESAIRRFAIVNIVLFKEQHIESLDNRIGIKRDYTIFQPLRYLTTPSYVRGESNDKYHEEWLPPIIINNDILEK